MKRRKKFYHNKIIVTKHAIKRYKERQEKKDLSNKEAIKNIIRQVKRSKLIGIQKEIEHRMLNGYIYVVKRQEKFSKDILYVITMKLSNVKKRQHYLDRFDGEHDEIVA